MHVTVFTSTRGHVYGDEMILSWMRIPEVLVLCERKKCGLPRNRLLGGTVSKTELQFTWGMLTSEMEMAEETASLNSRAGGLAVSGMKLDGSCKL